MLTYEQLQDIAESKKMTITEVAAKSGLTLAGLRKGMRQKSLTTSSILAICETLSISPNELLGVEPQHAAIPEHTDTIVALLRAELDQKNQQLAAQMVQINHLLGIGTQVSNMA